MDLGIISIVIAIVFLTYRFGLVKFTQTNIKRATDTTDAALELMTINQAETHSRRYGKIEKKMNDKTIARSNAKRVRKLLKEVTYTEQTTATSK